MRPRACLRIPATVGSETRGVVHRGPEQAVPWELKEGYERFHEGVGEEPGRACDDCQGQGLLDVVYKGLHTYLKDVVMSSVQIRNKFKRS